jgi:hypothetical protein
MAKARVAMAVDMVLSALIGPSNSAVENVIGMASRGEIDVVIQDRALYWALCCVREGDTPNFQRFAELVRIAVLEKSVRDSEGLPRPADGAISHWRDVALRTNESSK